MFSYEIYKCYDEKIRSKYVVLSMEHLWLLVHWNAYLVWHLHVLYTTIINYTVFKYYDRHAYILYPLVSKIYDLGTICRVYKVIHVTSTVYENRHDTMCIIFITNSNEYKTILYLWIGICVILCTINPVNIKNDKASTNKLSSIPVPHDMHTKHK